MTTHSNPLEDADDDEVEEEFCGFAKVEGEPGGIAFAEVAVAAADVVEDVGRAVAVVFDVEGINPSRFAAPEVPITLK